MTEKSTRSNEDSELTIDQVKDQLIELGKKEVVSLTIQSLKI